MTDEEIVEELQYLEALRKSGATNMYGATPYLQREFGIRYERAKAILLYWMSNYERLCEKYKWR